MNASYAMKAQQIRWLSMGLFVLGIAWAGWGLYDFFVVNNAKYVTPKSQKSIQEILSKETSTSTVKARAVRNRNDYRILSDLNVTGLVKVVDPEKPVEDVKPVTKKLSDALKVVFIQLDPDTPENTRAWIRFLDPVVAPEKKESYVKIGDKLASPYQKYKFMETKSDHEAVFKDEESGALETVSVLEIDLTKNAYVVLGGGTGKDAGTGEGSRIKIGNPGYPTDYVTPPMTKEVRENEYWIGSQDADRFETKYQSMLKDVQMTAYYDPVQKRNAGIQLHSVVPGSAAETYGARSGDIIRKINGNPVSSKEHAIDWVKKNPNLPRYDVEIERQGKFITKSYIPPPKYKK